MQTPAYCLTDTIYALASGHGKGGVAVVRVSGAQSLTCLHKIAGLKNPRPRYAYFAPLQNAAGEMFDQALVLYFKAPHSFTGEDVVEFQIHGGFNVIQTLMQTLAQISGCRPAERGEFSRRGVIHGKMDLTQAEGILDLINAETAHQRQQAFAQMTGSLSQKYEAWRQLLVRHMAYLEAFIDFPEEDIPPEKQKQIDTDIARLLDAINAHLDDDQSGQRLRTGFQIAIVGVPNVGKSSLINALTQRDVAIVSTIAGTTRDIVEAHLDVDGFPVILADTAGLRDTAHEIESEGIRRAVKRAGDADLVIHVQDAADYPKTHPLPPELKNANVLTLWNKSDMNKIPRGHLAISATTGAGLSDLWDKIRTILSNTFSKTSAGALTRERYRVSLMACADALARALQNDELELKAEELRLAARSLGRIMGKIEVDELLDIIFQDFCIGK
ncbi:MAG: tRNA uridine-5-carboxymethylaminomethyl(34) synthesis GTPase MnmE [Lactobacillales bacterium]|jgi:tRNA modification GTPase|nr:tRNA uridine-5-carboxymethylaminomethyl(34) synthesis GTPase MnmE [Lactobacillales bacterium]